MNSFEAALDIGGFDVEEVTVVDEEPIVPRRERRPEDRTVDRISLRRPGEGGYAQLFGPEAWSLAGLMLTAWSRVRVGSVEFEVRFGDGQTYGGKIELRSRSRHDLAAHCRRLEVFRLAFCLGLPERQAAALFQVFRDNYDF